MASQKSHFGRLWTVALAVALLLELPACNSSRVAPLQRSTTVVANVGTSSEQQTAHAIEGALAKRNWQVVTKTPGRYVAKLDERAHQVTINVDYSPQGITISYVDSANLLYSRAADGQETIHRKYETWIKNLAADIRVLMVQGGAPAPAAAPAPQAAKPS